VPVGSDQRVLTADSADAQGISYKDPDAVKKLINQTAHGFDVGDVIYFDGSDWALAQADVDATSEVLGIVSTDIDADNFWITQLGYVPGLSGLSAGTTYFLSPSAAGALTATEPTAAGQVSKPVCVATSTTECYVIHSRGAVIASQSSGTLQTNTYTLAITSGGGGVAKEASPVVDKAHYQCVGDQLHITWNYRQDAAGTAGSGDYLFSLPSGFTANTSLVETTNTTDIPEGKVGEFNLLVGTSYVNGYCYLSTSTTMGCVYRDKDSYGAFTVGSANTPISNATWQANIEAWIPVNECD
jgi:hypothetical protein